MSAAPQVTVVIPTYNHAPLLRRALASVQAQTMDAWEAVIVDNHSDDDTDAVVAAFDEPRFRLEKIHNQGVIAASRNRGIACAGAQWVAFLDSDDVWAPTKLERCLARAGETGAEVVSHPEWIVEEDGEKRVGRTATATPERVRFASLLLDGNCLSPTAIMVRTALLERAGGFAEAPDIVTAEDFDLWLRLAAMGARFAAVDEPLSEYRLHAGQSTRSVLRHMQASLCVLDRHYADWPEKTADAPRRFRRARALVRYSAGRAFQRAGERGAALSALSRALALDPLIARAWAAAALAVVGSRR